jgi:ABC-type branched-subunit amino acid transport system substrate-binding protein
VVRIFARVAFLIVLWAILPQSNAAVAQVQSRQFGILLPLSGEFEHMGRQMLDAIELALGDAAGMSWTVADTEGDPDVARRRVEALAANPANLAVIGPIGVAESTAAAEAAERLGIPLLTLTSDLGIEEIGPWILRLRVAPEDQARHMAGLAFAELGIRRFAIVYPLDRYGNRVARAFVDEVLALGGGVTAIESYEVGETNFNDAVQLLVNRRYRRLLGEAFRSRPTWTDRHLSWDSTVDFEALFIPDDHDRVGLILPFLSFWEVPVGGRVQLLGISTWAGRGLAKAEELAAGALFSQIAHEAMFQPAVAQLYERYRRSYDRSPSEAEIQAYDATSLLLELWRRAPAEQYTRESLRLALLQGTHESVTGALAFDEAGGVVRNLALFSTDGGGYIGPHLLLR